jgi:hypothetical protein
MSTPEDQLTQQMSLPDFINAVGDKLGVPKVLRDAIFERETNYEHYDVRGHVKRSPKGALGIGQLMPGTAARYGVDPNDPIDNAYGALQYQKFLYDRYLSATGNEKQAMLLTAAAYNSGEGNVDKYRGVPPFAETQNYVRYVASRIRGASREQSAYQAIDPSNPESIDAEASQLFVKPPPKDYGRPKGAGGFRMDGIVPPVPVSLADVKRAEEQQPSLADLKRYDEQAVNRVMARNNVRRAVRTTAPPGFSLLPKDMQEWIGGAIAKGAGGLTELAAGAMRDAPFWVPSMVGQDTKPAADFINRIATELNTGAMVADEEARRGFLSQTTQDVLAGSVSSAPAMALAALGVPAPIAFGLQGYMSARGRNAEFKELLLETGKGATIGALFELPIPKKLDVLARLGSKLGVKGEAVGSAATRAATVGAGTYAVERGTGAPNKAALTNAAVNALFASTGAVTRGREAPRMPEIPEVPVSTIPEVRVIKGGGKDYAAQKRIEQQGGQQQYQGTESVGTEAISGRRHSTQQSRQIEQAQKQIIPPVPASEPPVSAEPSVSEAVPMAASPAREPWEMTRDDYLENGVAFRGRVSDPRNPQSTAIRIAPFPFEGSEPVQTKPKDLGAKGFGEAMHRRAIEQALSEGKPVPPEVLKDYPDLAVSEASTSTRPQYKTPEQRDQSIADIAGKLKKDLGEVTPEDMAELRREEAGVSVLEGKARLLRRIVTSDVPNVPRETLPPEPSGVTSFTTAKGSEYVVNDDGTTTRNKAKRSEHPDSGPQPRSQKTFYVTSEDAAKLGEIQTIGKWDRSIRDLGDGRVGMYYEAGPSKGGYESRTIVPFEAVPRKGLTPVEIWKGGKGTKNVHFGNEITEVRSPQPETNPSASSKVETKPVVATTDTAMLDGKTYTRQGGKWYGEDGKPRGGIVKAKLDAIAPPLAKEYPADPDAAIQLAQTMPSKVEKSPINEAGFANIGEIVRGAGDLLRGFPDQIRDLAGAVKQRTAEARDTARNVACETLRAVALSQINPEFKKVWTGIITAQEEAAGRLYDVRQYLHDAWKPLLRQEREAVAKVVYQGNEAGRVYSPTELEALGLNERQVTAYQRVRRAVDTALDARCDQIIERLDDAIGRLTDPDQIAALERLKRDVNDHYMQLKSEGYVSLQRIGDYVVVAKAPDGTVHYDHEETARGAQRRAREFRRDGMVILRNEKMENSVPAESRRLSPEEFEQVIQSSGVNPDSPEVQQVRDEIYSRYPSKGYELKRDFTPGYKQTKDSLTASILRQGEVYTNTYKNSLGRLRAERALLDANVDPSLQRYSQRFIENEVNAAPLSAIGRWARRGRSLVYLKTLAGDVGQFYMNAVAQPIQMNYAYFARPEFGLRGAQPEIYFARGWKLAAQAITGRAPTQFQNLFRRAVKEGVGQAELTRSLAETEIHGRSRIMNALSIPMQLGERVTRAQALAESFLVGKEKLKLKGDDLYRYMADSTYATQTRMGAGEAPGAIRMTGEVGRSVYQFQAFQQMYLENLGLSIRSDMRKGVLPVSTARFVAGTIITAGLRGLPLAGTALVVSKAIFGDDWQTVFERLMKDHSILRDLALYGVITGGEAGASERLNAPFSAVPQVPEVRSEADLMPRIPTASTIADIAIRAPRDLYQGDYYRAAEDVAPKFARGPLRALRYEDEGIRTRTGKSIASRRALTLKDKLLTIFNVQTSKEADYYHKQRMQRANRSVMQIKRMVRRAGRSIIPAVPTETPIPAP